jgi:hypothetical protein
MARTNDATTPDHLDALAQIEANLDRELLEWAPVETGDTLIGYCRAIEYVSTKHGSIPTLQVETRDGALFTVWCGRARLKNQLHRAKLQPGDALGLRYLGQVESTNGGNAYHDYKVDVVRVGARREADMFKIEEDLGLTPAAFNHDNVDDDPWMGSKTQPRATTEEAPF